MKSAAFWVAAPSRSETTRRFGGLHCLISVCRLLLLFYRSVYSSTLKMVAICASESSYYMALYSSHHRENLEPNILIFVSVHKCFTLSFKIRISEHLQSRNISEFSSAYNSRMFSPAPITCDRRLQLDKYIFFVLK
jgi:hypothetical protein